MTIPHEDDLPALSKPVEGSFWRNLLREVRLRPLEAITALLGLLGLWCVVWQISEVSDQLDDDGYGRIQEWQRDLDTKLMEHPNYRPYFAEGKTIPKNQPVPQELKAFAEFKLDYLDYFFTEMPHLQRNDIEYPVWKKYFEDSFTESPILCDVLKDDMTEYGYEIRYFASPLCKGVTIPSQRVTNHEFWKYFGRK